MFKRLNVAAMVISLSLVNASLACSENGSSGFLPENNLKIPVGQKSFGGLTEEQFNTVIDKVEAIYSPLVASAGGKLNMIKNWSDATVNAYATQSGTNWTVNMFGGLARHNTITEDGMALVVCHELGHHLGGAPKIGGSASGGTGWGGGSGGANSWATNEGQADYFATLKCLRRVYLNDDNVSIVAGLNAPEALTNACKKSSKGDKEDSALCIRLGMSGQSVANLFSALSRSSVAKFETPDPKVVTTTNDKHPAAQCRLDTYFQGGLCDVSMNEDVSNTDEVKGTCHGSLGHKVGLRPLCWFKPSK